MIGPHITTALLTRMQAQATSLMDSMCTIDRAGERVMDPDTLEYHDSWTPVYAGRCRVRAGGGQATTATQGEIEFGLSRVVVSLPADTDPSLIRRGDRVTMADPALVATVQAVGVQTHMTALRMECEVVT